MTSERQFEKLDQKVRRRNEKLEGKPPTAAQWVGIAMTILAGLAFLFMFNWARLAQY